MAWGDQHSCLAGRANGLLTACAQATVGLLVAKTLTNATANPFLAGGAGSYNPVLALDVFLVQVEAPHVLTHGASPCCRDIPSKAIRVARASLAI